MYIYMLEDVRSVLPESPSLTQHHPLIHNNQPASSLHTEGERGEERERVTERERERE